MASHGKVGLSRWTHLGLVSSGDRLKLYINGILDSIIALQGNIVSNPYYLFLNGPATYYVECPYSWYLNSILFII